MLRTGRKYKTKFEGFIWKPVICPHCQCEYYYRVKVEAEGEQLSWMWLNNKGAENGASQNAITNFSQAIEQATNSYPCPNCFIYSPKTVRKNQEEKLGCSIFGILFITISLILISWRIFFNNFPLLELIKSNSTFIFLSLAFLLVVSFIIFGKVKPLKNPNDDEGLEKSKIFSESYPVLKRGMIDQHLDLPDAFMNKNFVLPWSNPEID